MLSKNLNFRKILGPSLLGAFVFFLVFSVPLFTRWLLALRINSIVCKSQYGPCPDLITHSLSEFVGESLILFSPEKISKKNILGIRDLRIRKKLPDTLIVEAHIRKPRVAVPTSDEKFLLFDREGVVVGETKETLLPKLKLSGEVAGEEFLFAVATISYLSNTGVLVEGTLSEEFLIRTVGTEVIFPKKGDAQLLSGSLHFILGRFKMEGKRPVKIDLRFKNPVVTF